MRQLILCVLLLTACVLPARGDEKKQPAAPAELKALELFLGEWKSEAVSKKAEWTPQDTKFTATDKIEWTLNKRFLTNKSVDDVNRIEGLTLLGYDSIKGVYTSHYFNSTGVMSNTTGKFDPKTNTFTWTGDADGLILRCEQRFTGDVLEGFFTIKDKAGKAYFDMTFKNTRKK